MEAGKIKFLLADDHSVIRRGVINSLAENFPDADFSEASNAGEVLQCVLKNRFDIIILDISMPGRNGLEVLKEIKDRQPETSVIFLPCIPKNEFGGAGHQEWSLCIPYQGYLVKGAGGGHKKGTEA